MSSLKLFPFPAMELLINISKRSAHFSFYRQLDFSSGVANKILENEPKSSLAVYWFYYLFYKF